MSKFKNKIIYISILIAFLIYYNKEHKYDSNHVLLMDNEAYAKYSNGYVYINKEDITLSDGDVLIIDERFKKDDPNIKIKSSHLINNKEHRNEILEILKTYENSDPSEWNRSMTSMRLEWFMHNFSYY